MGKLLCRLRNIFCLHPILHSHRCKVSIRAVQTLQQFYCNCCALDKKNTNMQAGRAIATAAIILPGAIYTSAAVALTRERDSPVSRPGTVASRSIDRMDHTNITNTGRFTNGVAINPSGCALCTDDTAPVQETAWDSRVRVAAASTSRSLGPNCPHALHRHGILCYRPMQKTIPSLHLYSQASICLFALGTRLHKQ